MKTDKNEVIENSPQADEETSALARGSDKGEGGGKGKGDDKPDDKGPGGKDEQANRNKIELVIVVNGQPTEVEANLNAPLHTVRNKALEATNNVGQPPENWELKNENGEVLDLDKKVGEFGFTEKTTLFLSLKAGVAGA
jgi:hypothetical protein